MTPGVVAESDLAGTLKSEYVFFDGKRVARRDLGLALVTAPVTVPIVVAKDGRIPSTRPTLGELRKMSLPIGNRRMQER
jgi:hypothetical protein